VGNSKDARLGNLLGAVAVGVHDAVADAIADAVGLDPASSTAVVAMLDFTPAGTVRRLSQVVGLTHSGAVRLVDRLVALGYVTRRPGGDARSRSISLTPAGRRIALKARRARRDALGRTLASLSPVERDSLTELSAVLVQQLTAARLAQRSAGQPPASGALCRLCDFTACGRRAGQCPAADMLRP
jgi:MarR family transcriptional regulator, negative regulator of the multidrug operon emrRAB